MKSMYLLLSLILTISCEQESERIRVSKKETHYNLQCTYADTCIQMIKTHYSDGSIKNEYYLIYPDRVRISKYSSSGTWLSEMTINGKDTSLSKMFFDDKGNELKLIDTNFSDAKSSLAYSFENKYDHNGQLKSQSKIDSEGIIKRELTFFYDTLDYSKIILAQNGIGDTLSIKYFKKNLLNYEQDYIPFRYIRHLKYNNDGLLTYEDPEYEHQLRRYYFYRGGRVDSLVEKYRVRDDSVTAGSSGNLIHDIIKFEYEIDKNGRPIKTIKYRISDEEKIPIEMIETKYS